MGEFLRSNEWQWRLARTVVQGIIGVVIANIDLIVGWRVLDPSVRARSGVRDGGALAGDGGAGRARRQPAGDPARGRVRCRRLRSGSRSSQGRRWATPPPQGKWNKYAEALDQTDLYNYAKNGYDWCDIFYDWLLVEELGVELAKAMTNQPTKGCVAGCDFSAS